MCVRASIYLCVSVFVQPCQNWNTQLLTGGRPATHVSPEGEETRHHIGGKGRVKGEAELMKERKGVVKVSRRPLYCRAAAVKTS